MGVIQSLAWSVGVQYSCQDPSEEESIQISLLSRLQPFSSTSSTNLKGEAGKNAKSAVSIVLQFLRSYIFRLFWFNPQHGITMGLPTLREGHFLMPFGLVVACLCLFSSSWYKLVPQVVQAVTFKCAYKFAI